MHGVYDVAIIIDHYRVIQPAAWITEVSLYTVMNMLRVCAIQTINCKEIRIYL